MLRRTATAVVLAGALLLGACGDKHEPTSTSENNGKQQTTPSSQQVPPGNPSSGETGTNGTNTGGG
jgi:major membrane immunogen (membrane-anchored lipoprotein)